MEVVGTNIKDPGSGGGKCAGLWTVLQYRGTIRLAIRVSDMGLDSPGGTYPHGLPPQGESLSDRAIVVAKI